MKDNNQNYINHIAILVDESLSMRKKRAKVIEITDGLTKHLANRSKEWNQETRITVYAFNEEVRCIFYDKDVLRLPSIADHYNPNRNTALVDATLKGIEDLELTPQIYGDHAFLVYVVTDGQENASKALGLERNRSYFGNTINSVREGTQRINNRLTSLPENWTVAVLVPDQNAKFEAKKYGFPSDNIAIWDVTSATGVDELGDTITTSTDTYMTNRSKGIRGSKTLFATQLNKDNIEEAKLKPIPTDEYEVLIVEKDSTIRDFVESHGHTYQGQAGMAYYQLTKTETIQPHKVVVVRKQRSDRFHTGKNARDLLGLPDESVRVKPNHNPYYDVFVQSTSVNRKLIAGTELLLMLK